MFALFIFLFEKHKLIDHVLARALHCKLGRHQTHQKRIDHLRILAVALVRFKHIRIRLIHVPVPSEHLSRRVRVRRHALRAFHAVVALVGSVYCANALP